MEIYVSVSTKSALWLKTDYTKKPQSSDKETQDREVTAFQWAPCLIQALGETQSKWHWTRKC